MYAWIDAASLFTGVLIVHQSSLSCLLLTVQCVGIDQCQMADVQLKRGTLSYTVTDLSATWDTIRDSDLPVANANFTGWPPQSVGPVNGPHAFIRHFESGF